MLFHRFAAPLALAGAFFTFSSAALADALPPDAEDCDMKSEGAACHTADGDAGACTTEMCTSSSPSCLRGADAAADAASCVSTYSCLLCVHGTTPVTTTDGGTTTTTTSSSDSGCSVTGGDFAGGLRNAAPFGLALLVPLALRRKKKRTEAKNESSSDQV